MIHLNDHTLLKCQHMTLAMESMCKLDAYQMAVDALGADYQTDKRAILAAQSRLAKAYYDAFAKAVMTAEDMESDAE